MSDVVFELAGAACARGGVPVLSELSWTVREGEAWAVTGPTGSGKTTLAEVLLGRHPLTAGTVHWPLFDRLRARGRTIDYPSQVVSHVTFRENSRLFSYAGHYYQQRYEFADTDTPLSLEQFLRTGTRAADPDFAAVCGRFGLTDRLAQPFMTLSNGQTRRARLARALLSNPELLVLDDPFIGLDAQARADLSALLHGLANDGRRLVLICRADAVPVWVPHRLALRREGGQEEEPSGVSGACRGPTPPAPLPAARGETSPREPSGEPSSESSSEGSVSPLPAGRGAGGVGPRRASSERPGSEGSVSPLPAGRGAGGVGSSLAPVLELREVTVSHGGRAILDRVSWTVRAGERWAVLGPNGSGKTTLLSLLCGDHPQAYSNDVTLFGRKRGSGETIWDVKRNVGLLSPEFHLYFSEPLTAARAAATGFFDTLADPPTTAAQDARVADLFAAFGVGHLATRAFKTLSTGEQRLVLLARALVKRPPLVILDEPFQGLDAESTARCRAWLETEIGPDQTLLFVTHELSELPRTVTRTLRLDRGRATPEG